MSERKGTKALELWCKRLVKDCPDVHIDNMTTSWRNGIAFCALVHHFRPDLIDMSKLKPEDIYENNQLAYSVAEKHLGIPSLLDPEDMVDNEVPDRLSILTYLSQFYQRLGHKVKTKVSENEPKLSVSPKSTSSEAMAPIRFGKTGLDKCAACGLPVYLAQRLLVSHKLYHRRCFRCSKCSGHLNPKTYIDGSEFICDSCKNEKTLSKFLNNNDHDQMGMLAFADDLHEKRAALKDDPISPKQKPRPKSILDKINMFEKNIEKDTQQIEHKITNVSLKDNSISKYEELSSATTNHSEVPVIETKELPVSVETESDNVFHKYIPDKVYKSNIDKFNFLQTQLLGDIVNVEKPVESISVAETKDKEDSTTRTAQGSSTDDITQTPGAQEIIDDNCSAQNESSNVTDDSRIANSITTNIDNSSSNEKSSQNDQEITISVPPRRKKKNAIEKALALANKKEMVAMEVTNLYPDHLNPFSDEEEENEDHKEAAKKESTNPFGSDEEDDEVPSIQPPPKPPIENAAPVKRLIAVNPFWSDGEEPSSDEETHSHSSMYKSSMATSTPNLPGSSARRKKGRAPAPPPAAAAPPHAHLPATSMDDVASISSLSSYNSTIHSDQKSTPILKNRLAPVPLDSLSTMSGCGGSLEKEIDTSEMTSLNSDAGRKTKGPAPGLPLPERREVKLQITPEELQVQLDLLETQQLGLERQGVLIERMIRDKCEGEEADTVPQEEVEDLVIQLCELVNEKNDLFRKQTELMYLRRQQRLEQEQADIEHEIRVIQSRPAVNRIDADKAREEQLVLRLVEIVRMRDELVQQIDAERRRERQEDLAIAASIANKRAQRNSDSTSSSMKSMEVLPSPKKNKVKDKVKKQLKKAKHTLISKKKEESVDRKDEKTEKEKKTK